MERASPRPPDAAFVGNQPDRFVEHLNERSRHCVFEVRFSDDIFTKLECDVAESLVRRERMRFWQALCLMARKP